MGDTIEEIHSLLDVVIDRFFYGEMSFEVAFGAVFLAKIYTESLMGYENSADIIEKYEEAPELLPTILPFDDVIQSQIDNLTKLQASLREHDEIRSDWKFWADSPARNSTTKPNLRLV